MIPGEYCGLDLTDPRYDEALLNYGRKRASSLGLTPEVLSWFRRSFTFKGPISEERFEVNLRRIRAAMEDDEALLLINGAEVEPEEFMWPFDNRQVERHCQMNEVLDRLVATLPRTYLIDVRTWVRSPRDVTDRLFHYRRAINVMIAQQAAGILEALDRVAANSGLIS